VGNTGNKGIAISSVLYLIMLIVGVLLISTLGVITFSKGTLKTKLESLLGDINQNMVKQYRYITEGGEWSSWIDYNDVNEINHSFNLKRISNLGNRGRNYDLTTTNITLNIIKGEAYISFNGSSKADSDTGVLTVANTIVFEVEKRNIGTIMSFRSDYQQGIFYTGVEPDALRFGGPSFLTTTKKFINNNKYRYVLALNKKTGTYSAYENGELLVTSGTDTDMFRIETISLGYLKNSNSHYLNGNLYNVALSTMIISSDEAKQLSKLNIEENKIILNKSNTEIIYGPFIEYRKIPLNKKDTSNDAFSTRYIKDFHNGNIVNSNNEIIEIEAYAHFALYNKFNDIMIGGTYSGDYNINNKLVHVSSGTFTHPNGRTYNLDAMDIKTPFTTDTSFGSGLILFNANINQFVYAEYSDKNNLGTNDWYYYDTTWHLLEPNSNNAIVGFVTKHTDDITLTKVNLFSNSFTFNVALGKSVSSSSNAAGTNKVVDGNRSIVYLNGTNSQSVTIDLGLEYNITEIRAYRQYTNNRATKSAKTILYNNNEKKSKFLWDSDEKGLYVESVNGTSFYVNQRNNYKTSKARYLIDCMHGRYAVSDNSYSTTNEWRELEVFDINEYYNLALNKPLITSSDTKTNLSNVNDGNKTTIFTASSGDVCVTVDLQQDYAIRSANILRSNQSYIDAKVKTLLLDVKQEYYYDLYNSEKEGLYRKDTQGIYLTVNNIDPYKTYAFDDTYNIIQGVNYPQLAPGMTPKKWSGSAWVTTTEYDNDWYRYDTTNKRWANAQTADGSMWVWIPRYIYKITSCHHQSCSDDGGNIDVKFSVGVDDTVGNAVSLVDTGKASDSSNKWTNHLGFDFGTTKLTGFWMAKFEASDNGGKIKIIPGVVSWKAINVHTIFNNCRSMETNSTYGWGTSGSGIDTHMMKNVEWGATAYLAKSSYGKQTQISRNESTAYYTGGGSGDAYKSNLTQTSTGNIYGVYDINGGSWEFVAAYLNNGNTNLTNNGSSLVNAAAKYKEVYSKGSSDTQDLNYAQTANKKGDAIYETSNSHTGNASWYSDTSSMPSGTSVFFRRGGNWEQYSLAGAFAFYGASGAASNYIGFRPVLVVGPGL